MFLGLWSGCCLFTYCPFSLKFMIFLFDCTITTLQLRKFRLNLHRLLSVDLGKSFIWALLHNVYITKWREMNIYTNEACQLPTYHMFRHVKKIWNWHFKDTVYTYRWIMSNYEFLFYIPNQTHFKLEYWFCVRWNYILVFEKVHGSYFFHFRTTNVIYFSFIDCFILTW